MIRPNTLVAAAACACLALLGSLPAVAATPCAEGGIGGAGAPVERGGIGGTGAPELAVGGIGGTGAPQLAAGGIGGTGSPVALGETAGVVGTITAFGSICVNGLRVQYDDRTPITSDGVPTSAGTLAIGQVVAVEAAGTPRGLIAGKVAILHAVVGPVSQVDARNVLVMGQRVRLPEGTVAPAPGRTVRVSGLRNADGEIIATRVDSTDDREFSVLGTIRNGRVGELRLDSGKALPEGAEVLVRGRLEGGRLRVRTLESEPVRAIAGRADTIVVEARVRDRGERSLQAAGLRIEMDDNTRYTGGRAEDSGRDRLVRVVARARGDGSFRAERVEIRDRRDNGGSRDAGGGESRDRDAGDGKRDDRDRDGRRDDRDQDRDRERQYRDRGARGDERPARAGREGNGHDDRAERSDRAERAERADRPERVERVDRD